MANLYCDFGMLGQVNGEYANREYVVPMATHEGALLASYSRGAKARTRSPCHTALLSNVSGWYILQSRTRFCGPEITPDLQSKAKLTFSRRLHKLKQRFSLGIFGKHIVSLDSQASFDRAAWIAWISRSNHRVSCLKLGLTACFGCYMLLHVVTAFAHLPLFSYIFPRQDPKAITAGGGVTTRIKTRCMLRAPVTWHLRNEWFTTFQNYAQPEIAEALQY